MFRNLILKVGCLLCLCLSLMIINQSIDIKIENFLEIIIKYLINVQSYFEGKRIKTDSSLFSKECSRHYYISRIIERSPLIIYIENFLRENEIEHLIKLAEPLFKPSMVNFDDGLGHQDKHRTSSSASINRHQTSIVKCLEQRFSQFQGGVDLQSIEPFQIVKYINDQQYKPHYDWFPHSDLLKSGGGQRVTTFFTYLQSNSSQGETEFVDIRFNYSLHKQYCDIIVCDEKSNQYGIRFRPLVGNTIFWYNMDEHGQVDYLTYHAAHPPGLNTIKIGLNTWTRLNKFDLPEEK